MKIDFSETFPHLPRAPIVEAVIDFRAKPTVPCQQEQFEKHLKAQLPDYPTIEPQRQFQFHLKAKSGKPLESSSSDLGWHGLVLRSLDKLQVAQFQKDGFSFNRLQPYQQWELFQAEALRLWQIYRELTQPAEIQRVGVRFINRMVFPTEGIRLDEYLVTPPQPPSSFPLSLAGFFHHDTFVVPDSIYVIQVIRTTQPPEGAPPKVPVILDIDVFTNSPLELGVGVLEAKLPEMRWLKNKVFFANISPKSLELFK